MGDRRSECKHRESCEDGDDDNCESGANNSCTCFNGGCKCVRKLSFSIEPEYECISKGIVDK